MVKYFKKTVYMEIVNHECFKHQPAAFYRFEKRLEQYRLTITLNNLSERQQAVYKLCLLVSDKDKVAVLIYKTLIPSKSGNVSESFCLSAEEGQSLQGVAVILRKEELPIDLKKDFIALGGLYKGLGIEDIIGLYGEKQIDLDKEVYEELTTASTERHKPQEGYMKSSIKDSDKQYKGTELAKDLDRNLAETGLKETVDRKLTGTELKETVEKKLTGTELNESKAKQSKTVQSIEGAPNQPAAKQLNEDTWEANGDMQRFISGVKKSYSADTLDKIKRQMEKQNRTRVFDELFNENTKMTPFDKGDTDTEWVSIELTDIMFLPIDEWMLANNTFLINCYRKYKHLILGRVKKENLLMLGIPDIYYMRERVIANICGFHQFLSCDGEPLRDGKFGYWVIKTYL